MKIDITIVKRYLPLGIGVLVYAGAVFGLIQLVNKTKVKVGAIQEDYKLQLGALEQLAKDKKAPPSKEDAAQYRKDNEALQAKYKAMVAQLGDSIEPSPELPHVQFYGYMGKVIDSLLIYAASNSVTVSSNFNLGFGYYETRLPGQSLSFDDAQKLSGKLAKQLNIGAKLANLLVDSKIEELTAVRRIDLEGGVTGSDIIKGSVIEQPDGLYWIMPFQVEFYGDARSVQSVLNNLAKAESFWMVRSVTLQTKAVDDAEETSVASSQPSSGTGSDPRLGSGGRFGGRFGSPAPTPPPRPGPPGAVMGDGSTQTIPFYPKTRQRLHVTMRIDYIEFPFTTNQVAGAETAVQGEGQ